MQLPKRKPGKYALQQPDNLITLAKLNEWEEELAKLKKQHPKAASEVARLAELGDFSENVEYQLAKGRLRGLNDKIFRLEFQINHAEIIKLDKHKTGIQIGNVVEVEVNGRKKTFQILGSNETKPEQGIISHSSPLGQVLLGKKVGEVAVVETGSKKVEYKILNIK